MEPHLKCWKIDLKFKERNILKAEIQTSKNKDSAIYFTQNSTEIFKIKCEFNDNGIEIIDLTEIINLSEQENKNNDTNIFSHKKEDVKDKRITPYISYINLVDDDKLLATKRCKHSYNYSNWGKNAIKCRHKNIIDN